MSRREGRVGRLVVVGAVLCVGSGLGLVALGAWRAGLGLAGASLGLVGVLRLTLSGSRAGPLRVRQSRLSDAALLLALGAALVTLAVVVPDQPAR